MIRNPAPSAVRSAGQNVAGSFVVGGLGKATRGSPDVDFSKGCWLEKGGGETGVQKRSSLRWSLVGRAGGEIKNKVLSFRVMAIYSKEYIT